MKVYTNIDEYHDVNNPIATIGTFDGVHIGHQQIIQRLKEIARKENGEVVLLTFHPHPRLVLQPENNDLRLINAQSEKEALLEHYGVDHLILYPFTREFSRLTSVEYVRDILVNALHVKKLVIGYDHQFGRNREGNFTQLLELAQTYNFEVEEIPAQDIQDVNVSSTKIRKALGSGDIETVSRYLGHAFTITGTVVEGRKFGKSIGFPTANLKIADQYKIVPLAGVYAVKVRVNGNLFHGMLNIGVNPTLIVNGKQSIEVNIFDFENDIYGQEVTVELVSRLRDEIQFETHDDLRTQLKQDKIDTLKILS